MLGPANTLYGTVALSFVIPSSQLPVASGKRNDTAKSPWMRGPEGRPPNVSPARKGWEINCEDDLSAVGAALNLRPSHLCPTHPHQSSRTKYASPSLG
jgi:hypothetical protein